jgi:hypothetical protein
MKQSQSPGVAIASLHFITLAMTKYVFTHLGCSASVKPYLGACFFAGLNLEKVHEHLDSDSS